MFAAVRDLLRRRPVTGLAASVILHGLLLALVFVGGLPATTYTVKRGEPIIVELPELPESPPPGRPAAAPRTPAVRESVPRPPTPRVLPPQPPREVARSEVAAPRPPAPPEPPVPAKPPVAAEPAPAIPEPPRSRADVTPEPSAPAPPPPAPAQSAAAEVVSPQPAQPAPPQVASIPPQRDNTVDIRSALRGGPGGGAGGRGDGRGGIEGEPIPLDSADPKFNDYLDRLRRKIKANWGFPCLKNDATRECEYMSASLVVHFGILQDGRLQFVEVVRSSGFAIYDDYAVNAIKFSTPFPPVPSVMMLAMKHGSSGVAIRAQFNYLVDTSLTNLLR